MAQVQRKQVQTPPLLNPKAKTNKASHGAESPQKIKPQESTEQPTCTSGFKIARPQDNETGQEEMTVEKGSFQVFKLVDTKETEPDIDPDHQYAVC